MSKQAADTQVLVVGAGPVGLTLAMDLAARGIDVTIAEVRRRGEAPEPKCNHVSARSMEIFRRLGVAKALRDAGLPVDYANDVSYRTTFTGHELTRIHIPCRRDRYADKGGPDGWWPTTEPPHRVNQIYLEPVLFEHAAASPRVRILNRTEVLGLESGGDGVTARIRDLDTGEERTMAAQFLAGCDGGKSNVRKWIGASLVGDAVVQRVQSTYFRAPDLIRRQRYAPAWATASINPRRAGTVYAIDGKERWLLHNYLKPDEADYEAVDRDWAIRTILGVGHDFQYEIISKEDWVGRRLVADKLREGRVFICGDAAHIWVPYAGYGMNAGIADAANLAWLIAAHLNGWAPYAILDAHAAERGPITEQVSRFAMAHAEKEIKRRGAVSPAIEDDSAEGERVRAETGRLAYEINVQQYCCAGLNFGSYYERSPLIAYDGEAHPAYTMASFTPSTVPGCRMPHLWLADGRSLYDAMGEGYALLCFDPAIDIAPLLTAAAARRVPLSVVDVSAGEIAPYRHGLVLARPDQHVAWRGDVLPADPLALVDRIRGAA